MENNQNGQNNGHPQLYLSIIALALDFAPLLFTLVMWGHSTLLFLFFVSAVICPMAGLAVGVCALCQGKQNIGRAGQIIAVIAITIPILLILAVIVIIILMSAGVAVIRFM